MRFLTWYEEISFSSLARYFALPEFQRLNGERQSERKNAVEQNGHYWRGKELLIAFEGLGMQWAGLELVVNGDVGENGGLWGFWGEAGVLLRWCI